ncbi:cobalamin synthase [Thermosipho melanesiensis]|uniref:Adenosylcobinamide-GDP ribazoletransferase n=2 Tax=Thermosipho melanesiensis TaxID=46541 RepID=COBS_THEM4|nr:adenosylcobinamide-GDP ribazoletransferase [Thermosipho melanesiensis]A6LLB7.1 RecName: Full=Adenosylcobinamide-GDP ribazoletransferase; AltName: Full=Cobalamin synthase; AltName: Full=Cobalamin-5'-phosphate synthase [Thermosipho melanesiensis BI429]ABR30718.1 cobalamin-5-phosphate synthase CobS [Thermosipho melanesiensis BI429]APT73847.1 cobalamin synthase [Thermosipho melanesiensis]OOC35787.1 cobalamin synthase [Thermosipho melanesiensis]OOC38289.1 cobalamin synthase [Thermosipho melanesi
MIYDFLLSLGFISRIPINIKVKAFEVRVKRLPIYFPLVGYIPGILFFFGGSFENFLLKILFLILGYYFFDLFHFDGFLDTLDGFLNQSSKEKRLEIMSKGDVGPFAVFFGTLYVVVFWTLYLEIPPITFIYSSVFGRYSMNLLMFFSKPAKKTGLGALFFPFQKKNLLFSSFFLLPLLFSMKYFFISYVVTVVFSYLMSIVSNSKIGGVTGDVLGGACLMTNGLLLVVLGVV